MKKYLLLMVASVAICFTACTDGETEREFEVPLTIEGFSVNALPQGATTVISEDVITTGIEAQLNTLGLTLESVKRIEAQSVVVRITGPTGANFDAAGYVEAFFTDGTDTTKAAFQTVIPNGVTQISMDSEFSDLAPIIKKNQFTFFVRMYNDAPFNAATGAVDVVLKVRALVD